MTTKWMALSHTEFRDVFTLEDTLVKLMFEVRVCITPILPVLSSNI